MAKRMTFPRNEASRADLISGPTRVFPGARNDLNRQEMIRSNAYGNPNVSIALTGTVTDPTTREHMVTGGRTLIITVTGDEWVEGLGDDNDLTTAFIAGIFGEAGQSAGWDDQILAGDGAMDFSDMVRTDARTITFTIPASASFTIDENETITALLPDSAFFNGERPVGPFTFAITNSIVTLTGTAIAGGVLESEIVTGSETVIMTLTGGQTWGATLGADNALTTAFLDSIVGDLADVAGFNAEVTLVHQNLARTSATILTLTLPTAGSYSITSDNEIVTIPFTVDGVLTGFGIVHEKTFTITEGS